jgi:hypothetical protein
VFKQEAQKTLSPESNKNFFKIKPFFKITSF